MAAPSLARPGLLLPPGVVQPLFLRYRRDDLHIMAFIEGHPVYEAVEAMIRRRPSGHWAIRAILTKHDQSQIDHINDDALLAEMQGAEREIHCCTIDLAVERSAAKPQARLAFTSMGGEEIVLDIVAVARPAPSRAGLSDPGGHSARISLPLMWRGASALAGPATHVMIDGARFEAPRFVGAGALDARKGYFTEGHTMGVVRAGTVDMKVLQAARHLGAGAQWVFEADGREVRYRAVSHEDGGVTIEGPGGQSVVARPFGDRLSVSRISVADEGDPTNRMFVNFDEAGGFAISVEGQNGLVSGWATTLDTPTGAVIRLDPTMPEWAVDRKVRVDCVQSGNRLTFTTTIGG